MLLLQTGNGKRNGQFSELLISSGDTLGGGGWGGIRELQSFVSGPQCSGVAGGRGICLLVVTSLRMRLACSINL